MAFPTVAARTATASAASNAASFTPSLSAHAAGDLLILVVSADGAPVLSAPADWVKLGQTSNGSIVTGAIFSKQAASNAEAAPSIASSVNEQFSAVSLTISGANPQLDGASANGSSTNSNPPALTPPGGPLDHLWIVTRSGDGAVLATAAPASFINLQSQAGGSNGASTNTAERSFNAASLDPGVFTSASEQWVSWTLAIWEGPNTGLLDQSEAADSLVAAGGSDVAGSAATSAAADVIAVAADLEVAASLAAIDARDALVAQAEFAAANHGSVAAIEAADAMVGGALILEPLSAGLEAVEQADTSTISALGLWPALAAFATIETADAARVLVDAEHRCSWNPPRSAEPGWAPIGAASRGWTAVGSGASSPWAALDADAAEWMPTSSAAEHWLSARMNVELEQEGFLELEGCGGLTLDLAA